MKDKKKGKKGKGKKAAKQDDELEEEASREFFLILSAENVLVLILAQLILHQHQLWQ